MLYLSEQSCCSFKPAMVVRHAGASVNIKYLDVVEINEPEYLAINPRGKVPFLQLNNGSHLASPNAIAWYLAEGSELLPTTAYARAQAISWINFEQMQIVPNLSPARRYASGDPDLGADKVSMLPIWYERGHAALSLLNKRLSGRSFITDSGYSVADIVVFAYTHLAGEGGFSLSDYPAICQWIERVGNETGYLLIDELLDGNDVFPLCETA